MSQLIVLGGGRRGNREIFEWHPTEVKTMAKAKQIFEDKLSEGYAAFRIMRASRSGQQLVGEQVHEFDSRAETIQMTPPMAGG